MLANLNNIQELSSHFHSVILKKTSSMSGFDPRRNCVCNFLFVSIGSRFPLDSDKPRLSPPILKSGVQKIRFFRHLSETYLGGGRIHRGCPCARRRPIGHLSSSKTITGIHPPSIQYSRLSTPKIQCHPSTSTSQPTSRGRRASAKSRH